MAAQRAGRRGARLAGKFVLQAVGGSTVGASFQLTGRALVRSGFLSVSGGPKGTRTP